ncbi:hypothetical protein HYY75_12550, partial [bacterium]|nr:hypothetical protein [bacterium]
MIFLSRQFFLFLSMLVEWLSFNDKIETLVETLNHKLDEPPTKLAIRHPSHPGGFVRELDKRRLNIASAYIKIAHDLSPEDTEGRLSALTMLIDQSLHAKTLNMPLNTARVQINLMKEAVKARGDKRKQMEAMSDFGLASFGHEAVIRDFLARMHMVEVPEEEKPLKDLGMGWDNHVHDNLTEGRKTPTQVLLDAFVKGISELTLVHSHIEQRGMIHETISAGNILGIKVKIGIEFSVGMSGVRRHYLYIPPYAETSKDFFSFFDNRKEVFSHFYQGILANIANRRKTLIASIERFNSNQRSKINSGYEPQSPYSLQPLTIEDLDRIVLCGQATQTHLCELMFLKTRDI